MKHMKRSTIFTALLALLCLVLLFGVACDVSYQGPSWSEIMSRVKSVQMGVLFGYEKVSSDGADIWQKPTEEGASIPPQTPEGWVAVLADLSLGDLLDQTKLTEKIENTPLSVALGMTERDGVWYTDAACTQKAVPLLSHLATTEIGRVGETIPQVRLGYLFGFSPVYEGESREGAPDRWEENGLPVTDGIRAALANLTVAELEQESTLSDACKAMTVADVLGYTQDPATGLWYEDGECTREVSALMQIMASAEVQDLSRTVDDAALGRLLGYVKVDGVWYTEYTDDQDAANDVPVTGLFALIGPDTPLSELDTRMDAVKTTETIGAYESAGLIEPFTAQQTAVLDDLYADFALPEKPADTYTWRDLTLSEFIGWTVSFAMLYHSANY